MTSRLRFQNHTCARSNSCLDTNCSLQNEQQISAVQYKTAMPTASDDSSGPPTKTADSEISNPPRAEPIPLLGSTTIGFLSSPELIHGQDKSNTGGSTRSSKHESFANVFANQGPNSFTESSRNLQGKSMFARNSYGALG